MAISKMGVLYALNLLATAPVLLADLFLGLNELGYLPQKG